MTHILDEPETFAFAGDWHQNAAWAKRAIEYCHSQGVTTILQLGDFLGFRKRPCNVFLNEVEKALVDNSMQLGWIDGNHENFPMIKKFAIDDRGVAPMRPHISYLPRGLRWTWGDISFLALGGATSLDKRHRTPMDDWFAEEEITYAEVEAVVQAGPTDVVLAHDAPSLIHIPGLWTGWPEDALRTANNHRALLTQVVELIRPALWVHGHFHVRYSDVHHFDVGAIVKDKSLPLESVMYCFGLDCDGHTTMAANVLVTNMDEVRNIVASGRGLPTLRKLGEIRST